MLFRGIGYLSDRIGYRASAGAVVIALEDIKQRGIDFNWKCEAYCLLPSLNSTTP